MGAYMHRRDAAMVQTSDQVEFSLGFREHFDLWHDAVEIQGLGQGSYRFQIGFGSREHVISCWGLVYVLFEIERTGSAADLGKHLISCQGLVQVQGLAWDLIEHLFWSWVLQTKPNPNPKLFYSRVFQNAKKKEN